MDACRSGGALCCDVVADGAGGATSTFKHHHPGHREKSDGRSDRAERCDVSCRGHRRTNRGAAAVMAPLSLDALRREAEAEMRRKAPREIDGADVAKKRRKTAADGDGGDDDANDDHDGSIELDVSLERYEYAAPAVILSGNGGACGFAITCQFMREKSATKEAMALLAPHCRAYALNPVKMPGRGFVFVRLSERTPATTADADAAAAPPSEAVSGIVRDVVRAVAAAGSAGKPRWVEKMAPVQFTCDAGDVAARVAARADGWRALAAAEAKARGDGKKVNFAVVYRNRFRSDAFASGGGGKGAAEKEKEKDADAADADADAKKTNLNPFSRAVVLPAVAAAVQDALRGANDGGADASSFEIGVDLRDPDVVVFVEVLSVPDAGGAGAPSGRFARRLAVGVASKSSGTFAAKKKGIEAASLKGLS